MSKISENEYVSPFTVGNWSCGNHHSTVISDRIPENYNKSSSGHDAVDYYGGFLIAESVHPNDVPVLSQSKNMFTTLVQIRRYMLERGVTFDNAAIYNTIDELIKRIDPKQPI